MIAKQQLLAAGLCSAAQLARLVATTPGGMQSSLGMDPVLANVGPHPPPSTASSADAPADEKAPFSEATKEGPPNSSRANWEKARDSVIGPLEHSHPTPPQLHSFQSTASVMHGKHLEKDRVRRLIHSRLANVETNFDAYFARREREAAAGTLDNDTLQAEVKKIKERSKSANRFLIPAHSTFMQVLDVSTMFALLYTAAVSPYEIAFLPEGDYLVLVVLNYCVLTVFAVGMVSTFFVPYREPLWMGGAIVKSHRKIAIAYLQTWFFFDLISTLPLDEIASMGSSVDASDSEADGTGSSAALRVVRGARLVRLVRLARLIKLGRLLRAQRIISRMTERLEGKSEWLNLKYTSRAVLFWIVVMLVVIHWFCCSWGILSLIQDTQRFDVLVLSLDSPCRDQLLNHINSTYTRGECLLPCEMETLAAISNLNVAFVANEEPWICRRINEGIVSGRAGLPIYFHLLYHSGLLRNPGSRTGRMEENIMFFVLSYMHLVLNAIFIGSISSANSNSNPHAKAWQVRAGAITLPSSLPVGVPHVLL